MNINLNPTIDLYSTEKVGLRLCISGRRDILVNGQLFVIEKNVLLINSPVIPVYEIHRDSDYEEAVILEDIEVLYAIMKERLGAFVDMRPWENPCLRLNEAYVALFHERKRLIDAKQQFYESVTNAVEKNIILQMRHLLVQETILEFMYLYLKNSMVRPKEVKKNEAIAFKFIYSLNQNFKTHRSVAYYAEEANLSLNHFTRLVKQHTGMTPSAWIIMITILNAKSLLKQTNLAIKEIAAELNFPEQFTFRKFFKQHVGIPPKEYRAKMIHQQSSFCAETPPHAM